MIDLIIVAVYFTAIFATAISGRIRQEVLIEAYFLSSRNLRWPSIALSMIATNVNGYQFLGMMGSAYLYGLAQASLEINAVQGILMAAFIFVPLFLREQVITVTQYVKQRLGQWVALAYSLANLLIFSTITLGAALFWGAYAADLVFSEYLSIISPDRITRISVLIVGLGVFSATYTYFGGLNAVVKTDIIQFSILLFGGFVVLFVAIYHLGGWRELYRKTPQLMHLYLPSDHPTLPWIHMFGLFLLNINYWCANQTILLNLVSGITMGLILLYLKFSNPDAAFTHTLNELRYYINCGIVVLICSAGFMIAPNQQLTLAAFLATIPLHLILRYYFPEMNYFVRAIWVILIAFSIVSLSTFRTGWRNWRELIQYDSPGILQIGTGLLVSLILLHVIFS